MRNTHTMKYALAFAFSFYLLIGRAAPAAGQDATAHADEHEASYERGGLAGTGVILGLKVGAGFSQPFGDLGSSFITELELGYALPFAKRSLSVFVSGAYTQPKAEGKNLADARLPGPARYELVQQEAMVTLGLSYRLHVPSKIVRPYLSAGPRLFLMRTKINGSADGQPFGKNEETASSVGVFAALGTELHLGPGAVLIELSTSWAKIDGYVLRATSAGALGLALGYRIFL
jgi:hypothetical protein